MVDTKNLIIASVLSVLVILLWQYFYELPRQQALQEQARIRELSKPKPSEKLDIETALVPKERSEVLGNTGLNNKRIRILTDKLHGSISLKGARFDDLTLANYHLSLDQGSPEVPLLSPSGSKKVYFAEIGWIAGQKNIQVPDTNTVWQADKTKLSAGETVHLSWENNSGIRFLLKIALDENFMFHITQSIQNNSGNSVSLFPYGLINRARPDGEAFYVLHEGPIGVFNQVLEETSYESLKDDKEKRFDGVEGWLGISDKYWLTAFIPNLKQFDAKYGYNRKNGQHRYQADFLGEQITIAPGEVKKVDTLFFAGAKKVKLLDDYASKYDIPLFDRAVDFGWFYFLTKPMFHALHFFNSIAGNFGIAIMLLTVCVKILMFPLALKSYKAMSKMKLLHPEMIKLRERFKNDQTKFNQELMALYRREQVNPVAGCLPLLLQIPVFFSIYKVIFITIEMRHAPFFGWIKDLSIPDPTSIFNLFGLLPFDTPGFLAIGVWPLAMGLSMFLLQKLNPAPTDPMQAKIMKMLPLVFIFIFAGFPAGLVIYWTWSNILSMAQQYVIMKGVRLRGKKKSH